MRRTILLIGVLPFVSAFLGGVLAFSLVTAPQATAQSSEAQEVRASAFTLVRPDGTVVGRFYASEISGAGILTLSNAAGTRRVDLVGNGAFLAFEEDGTTVAFRSGRTYGFSPFGDPPLNGVQLYQGGSISTTPPSP